MCGKGVFSGHETVPETCHRPDLWFWFLNTSDRKSESFLITFQNFVISEGIQLEYRCDFWRLVSLKVAFINGKMMTYDSGEKSHVAVAQLQHLAMVLSSPFISAGASCSLKINVVRQNHNLFHMQWWPRKGIKSLQQTQSKGRNVTFQPLPASTAFDRQGIPLCSLAGGCWMEHFLSRWSVFREIWREKLTGSSASLDPNSKEGAAGRRENCYKVLKLCNCHVGSIPLQPF